ncbi:MAG: PilT/PilU family type 4a pilus ATPase [Acidobacteriaceae bacterium]
MSANDSELARLVEELNRSVNRAPRVGDKSGTAPRDLDQLLALAAQRQASDLLLVANSPIAFRINGALATASSTLTSPDDVRSYLQSLLTTGLSQELERNRSIDFCFMRPGIGRFRANVHYQRGSLAAAIRLLPAQIPSLDSLHLPAILAQLAERRQGFVLFTGPTGCGKTSSLAALIDLINARRRDHIITIEDPIEYEHPNRSSIVEQVEVGADARGFAEAVRSVLRQNPDVILIGEIRDAETMSAALTAAETGHLVLSSLHTNDTAQTISRILDVFPTGHQQQIRQQLSLALLAIVAQQLVPASNGTGRYPATEVMMANFAMRNLIRQGHDHQIRSQIMIARGEGMMTMDQSLGELVRANRISRETAFAHCHQPDDLRRQLDSAVV